MEVRKIQFQDFGVASRLLKKIDTRSFVKKFQSIKITKEMTEDEVKAKQKEGEETGIELFMYLAENYHIIEDEAVALIASWTGEEKEKVKQFELDEIKEVLLKVAEANGIENLKTFFLKAANLMK